ncbi:MAG: isoleucine--tRNA ligase [Bacteroidia bacterium]|nr:isoleucine--tRNA ligase [Bacteroidia bacterium]
MTRKFTEYKGLDLPAINMEVLKDWEKHDTFAKSLSTREGQPAYIFYEGPPSANGMPGIHHVMARTIKDIFCRYKTLKGYLVERKAGWDTHGLPVELGVEKSLGITKEDIGTKISISEYNDECRKDVMKYTDMWEDLTHKMGYWVDMENPYITYDNHYIESLWYLLKELFDKNLLYKGYSIQPYSPAAGTGLSTHELNLPGCYRDVKDTTVIAQFRVIRNELSEFLFKDNDTDIFFLAWTTTPWTLLSNTALAVGKDITYIEISTFNAYTGLPVTVILAEETSAAQFPAENENLQFADYKPGDKKIPFRVIRRFKGKDIESIRYEQLLPYQQPTDGDAFRVLTGDFVTTGEGTGIVHIAPSFGADDFRVAKMNGIGSLTLVDKQGKFIENCGEFSGRFVKNAYDPSLTEDDPTVDLDIAMKLKKENKAFRIEKYIHSYPHCWRTDKPVLYYPLDSWFIRTTAVRDQMIELNNTINWKPASTGSGRFGKWLENLVDWNLSRSRFWGTPLPIWVTEDRNEMICIGSVEQLKNELEKSVAAGFMASNPLSNFKAGDYSRENYQVFDLHRPFVDEIFLVSPSGKKMFREADLIDVWFDSGAMPYAQFHYPFESSLKPSDGKQLLPFPADFIAEGVDQTRGWLFTLHAISTMISGSVAFKNIISNGLVLDKDGNKMSKRLGNAVDPFDVIKKHGSDPLRWYMIANAPPWDNLKFDHSGIEEVKRKFFGTLYNTYAFFALYANVDGFTFAEPVVAVNQRPEIDRWIMSLLNSLIREVEEYYEDYNPTKAARAIQDFVTDNLSNWYVRLNRKRFWGGEYSDDKISACQTLYTCLETVAILASPVAPFYMDRIFNDLNKVTGRHTIGSVHLVTWPQFNPCDIDTELEHKMALAQRISSMVLSLRRKVSIKVRQPLSRIMVPVTDAEQAGYIEAVRNIILTEVNVKDIELITDVSGLVVKKIKPDFSVLGRKFGKLMKQVVEIIARLTQQQIISMEEEGSIKIEINGQEYGISLSEVEIITEDIPGWLVASDGNLTVALDINISKDLREEGIARELVNRIQNMRKDSGFDVTDKINIEILKHDAINDAVMNFRDYISAQTLALSVQLVDLSENNHSVKVEIDQDIHTYIKINKVLLPQDE